MLGAAWLYDNHDNRNSNTDHLFILFIVILDCLHDFMNAYYILIIIRSNRKLLRAFMKYNVSILIIFCLLVHLFS